MITADSTYSEIFSFTQEQVIAFAQITGDTNPVHLDASFAAGTAFGKPILHGFLSGSVFSRILGTRFPGPGTIYLAQSMEFLRPMYPGQQYQVKIEVKELNTSRHQAIMKTEIIDVTTGKVTLRGEAKVMNATQISA